MVCWCFEIPCNLKFFGSGCVSLSETFFLCLTVFFVHCSRCMQYLFRIESSAEWEEARVRRLLGGKKAEEEVHCWKGYCNQVYHESLLLCNRNSSLSIPVFKHYLMKKENKPTKVFMKFNKIYSQTLNSNTLWQFSSLLESSMYF